MPEKSVREMSAWERKRYSLEFRVWNATVFNSVIVGLVTLAIGLGLYTYALSDRYISEAFHLAHNMATVLESAMDATGLTSEFMETYNALTEEERSQVGTRAYIARFSGVTYRYDYRQVQKILQDFRTSSNIDGVYLACYDEQAQKLVYLADADMRADTHISTGEWRDADPEFMESLRQWDGGKYVYKVYNGGKGVGWRCISGFPVRNDAGDILCYVLTDVTFANLVSGMKNFAWQFTLAMSLVVTLLAYFSTKKLKQVVVVPVTRITEAAMSYMDDKKRGAIGQHRFFGDLHIDTGDEIENLSLVLADMETDLGDYVDNLTAVTAEKERIGAELSMAADIQSHVLPRSFPAFPGRKEFDIYATMHPAKEVGGDFYDFFMVGDDHLAMVVADVSGKGVPAALFMMTARTLIKTQAQTGLDPVRVLLAVNAALREGNDEYMFVTVWLGILQISTGELTYADAGHEKLLLYQDGAWRFLPKDGGVALGMYDPEELAGMGEKYQFRNQTVQLHAGDAIFQYTDGVTEATDANNELFGDDRLLEAMNSAPSAKPETLLPHVQEKIDAFVQDAPQFDDITMLGLQLN